MDKPLSSSGMTLLALLLACGPKLGNEDDIPGALVYEQRGEQLHRLDRRIEIIYDYDRENGIQQDCGLLTDRAFDELEDTLAALDPNTDYSEHRPDCGTYGALVHIDGFEHSPFECTYECCHPDLHWAAVVYSMIINNFYGGHPTLEGEPYVAIEPDQPCS